jgi:hypothetical protein
MPFEKKKTWACAVPGTAPGGVFIFFVGLRLPRKNLKFFGFSRGSHLRFLSTTASKETSHSRGPLSVDRLGQDCGQI